MGNNGNGVAGLGLGDALMHPKVATSSQNKKAAKRQEVKKGAMTDSSGTSANSTPSVGKFNFSALKVAPKLLDVERRRFIPTAEEVKAHHQEEQAKRQEVLDFCREIGPYMHDLATQAWEIIQASEEDAYLYAEGKAGIEAEIRRILDSDENFRIPGLIAFADAVIQTAPSPDDFKGVVGVVIDWLVKEKFLVAGIGNGVWHRGVNYVLHASLYKREEARKVLQRLLDLRTRSIQIQKEETKTEFEKLMGLEAQNPISWEQVLRGEEGFLMIEVPDKVDGEKVFRGGFVLLRVVGDEVRLVDGVGSMHRYVAGFNADSGVKIEQLLEENPKFVGLDRRDQNGIHGLIRRFIVGQEQAKQAKTETRVDTTAEKLGVVTRQPRRKATKTVTAEVTT